MIESKIISKQELAYGTFTLRFERKGLDFTAGQHILVAPGNFKEAREYSIYSGEKDDYLEILVKEIPEGNISPALNDLKIGERLKIGEPVGYFILPEDQREEVPMIFLASGTGIAPFHSYIRSYPALDYTLVHGIRYEAEAYHREHYDPARLSLCTSREDKGNFHGRITDYLKQSHQNPDAHYYLCGNINMIHDSFDILQDQGVPTGNLHAEVYF